VIRIGQRTICVGRDKWREALLDQFERVEDATITADWRRISAAGNVTWATESVKVEDTLSACMVSTGGIGGCSSNLKTSILITNLDGILRRTSEMARTSCLLT